jgi:DNA-binding CsgD family transcriptional regulator
MIVAAASFDWANCVGPRDECVALARRALAERSLFQYDLGTFWCGAALVVVYADEPDAGTIWDTILAEEYRGGSLFAALTTNLWGGYTELLHGELDDAWNRFQDAAEQGTLWGAGERIDLVPAAFIGQVLVEYGRLGEARQAIEAPTLEATPGRFDGNLWRRAEIELLLAEGDAAQAHERAVALGETLGRMDNPAAHPWRGLAAQALGRLDRVDQARELAAEELALAESWGAPSATGRALRILGALEGADGIERLERAVEVLERGPARLELARALAALGTRLRLDRKGTDAREPLLRALELAEACGARALADDLRTELGATGLRPRRSALKGVEALTASEKRVAELAAGGMTNREIAQELYVTPKTVEVHLSNTYRKLEVRGRRDLAGVLNPDA